MTALLLIAAAPFGLGLLPLDARRGNTPPSTTGNVGCRVAYDVDSWPWHPPDITPPRHLGRESPGRDHHQH